MIFSLMKFINSPQAEVFGVFELIYFNYSHLIITEDQNLSFFFFKFSNKYFGNKYWYGAGLCNSSFSSQILELIHSNIDIMEMINFTSHCNIIIIYLILNY